MLPTTCNFILYRIVDSKTHEIFTAFPLKLKLTFRPISIFFSPNNAKRKLYIPMYLRCLTSI